MVPSDKMRSNGRRHKTQEVSPQQEEKSLYIEGGRALEPAAQGERGASLSGGIPNPPGGVPVPPAVPRTPGAAVWGLRNEESDGAKLTEGFRGGTITKLGRGASPGGREDRDGWGVPR